MNRWALHVGILVLMLLTALVFSCGGGGGNPVQPGLNPIVNPPGDTSPKPGRFQMHAQLLKNTQGVPSGIRITWTRMTDATAVGYYLYRDDATIPAGNPDGYESLRINGGNMIDQPGSGDTVSFDDQFDPAIGSQWYYRLTVVNDSDDESDFSNELSITIAEFEFVDFDPDSGTVGDTVTLSGTNFGEDEVAEDAVYFTGESGWVEAAITDWTQTEIGVTVPVGAVTGPIRVEVGGLSQDSDDDYTVLAPTVSGVSPTSDYAEHNNITITGSRFEATQGTSIVTFNGVQASTYV
jgi:hypothetical protein